MSRAWWRDPVLVQLQRDHVATLSDWLSVMPDPRGPEVGLDPRQRERLCAAIQTQAAYRARLNQLDGRSDAGLYDRLQAI